jgi:hypothetical protein
MPRRYQVAKHQHVSWRLYQYFVGQLVYQRQDRTWQVPLGVLESMVEATLSPVGHTYLQHLHTILHPVDWDGIDLPYFSFTLLDKRCTKDLHLWKRLLTHNEDRCARATKLGTLISSFGDGSSTGTGGSVQYHDALDFEMWRWECGRPDFIVFFQIGRRHRLCT